MPWRPLPSSGSLWVRFPGLIGTMKRSDFLQPIPGGSLTRPPVPPLRCFILLPPSASTASDGPGFWSAGSPTGSFRTETTGSPEFPSDPLDTCPAPIRPRRDRDARPFGVRNVAFRQWHGVGSHEYVISGLNNTACIFAVYASQGRLPDHHARLASGRRPALPGRDSTRRICLESFRVTHLTSSLPPPPSFARRTPRAHLHMCSRTQPSATNQQM